MSRSSLPSPGCDTSASACTTGAAICAMAAASSAQPRRRSVCTSVEVMPSTLGAAHGPRMVATSRSVLREQHVGDVPRREALLEVALVGLPDLGPHAVVVVALGTVAQDPPLGRGP